MSMLRSGSRGAVEEIFLMQVEEAAKLRTEMRKIIDRLRAQHDRDQEMSEQRRTSDHRVLDAIAALTTFVFSLDAISRRIDSAPARIQDIVNSADVTAIHKTLADALEMDIWTRLIAHTDDEAKRFATICAGVEKSMHAAVHNLRDAHIGKPSFPTLKKSATSRERRLFRFRCFYVSVVRICADVHDVAVTFAALSAGLACIALLIYQISRMASGH